MQLLEGPMVLLGFIWLLLLIAELIWGLNKPMQYLSITIWVIFVLDFILRFILAPFKIAYLKKNWLTAFSLIIPAIRVLRIFRLFRWLRGLRSVSLIKVVSSVNRSIRSLNATLTRRGMRYVFALTVVVIFAGAAAMYNFEKDIPQGLHSYGHALWWTSMLIITIGSDYWPQTPEGRSLCFLLSLYGFSMLGYITATLASFFVGRDAEEKTAPIAGTNDIKELKKEISQLTQAINELKAQAK